MPVKNKSEKYRSYLNDGYADCLATFSCVAVVISDDSRSDYLASVWVGSRSKTR